MAKTEVAKTSPGGVILPDGLDLEELTADAAQLNPQLGAGDVALPYIVTLQGNSPQVNPGKAEYMEEAKVSMFYNNVTGKVYEGRNQGLMVVPCGYERKIMEWIDRDAGGGLVGEHALDSGIMAKAKLNEKKKPVLPNGNILVETAYHYCTVMDPDTSQWFQGVVALASTALACNRKWNNLIESSKIPGTDKTAPRFLFPYQMTTEPKSKGDKTWFIPDVVRMDEPCGSELYHYAKKYATMVTQGLVNRAPPPDSGDGDSGMARDSSGQAYDPKTGEIL